eukprot:gene36196-48740_t
MRFPRWLNSIDRMVPAALITFSAFRYVAALQATAIFKRRMITLACVSGFGFGLTVAKLSPRTDGGIKLNGFASFCEGEATLDRSNPVKSSAVTDPFAGTALYPPINPSFEGFLKVSDVHTIAYSIYGNPNGKPVLFVHGGPGGGTDPFMARYFDPSVYRIILVDQRGCGKSTPFADLTDNTTYDSVRDFEKLRELLSIDKWLVFGGSWGSTLSLAYSMEHPERVTELVLRGIFLVREKELQWLYQ